MTDRLAPGTVADSPPMPALPRAALCGLGCLAAALLGIALSRHPDSVASIWLPNAVLLAVALRAPYAQLGPVLGAGTLAIFVANLLGGHEAGLSAGYTIANLVSVLVPLLWLRRDGRPPFVLAERAGPAVQLLLAVLAGTTLSALAGGMLVAVVHGVELRSASARWLASDLMGMVAVLPLGLRAGLREWRSWLAQGRHGEAAALYLLCTAGTLASLYLSPYPFVTIGLPLLFAALRLGMSGTALLCAYETALFTLLVWGSPVPLPESYVLHSYGPAFNALAQLAPLTVAWLFECRAADVARLRASEERLRSAMRDSAIGMAMIDLDERFVAVNPALGALGGYEPMQLLGHPFAEFVHGPDRFEALSLAQRLVAGTMAAGRVELRGLRADGTTHWLRVVASCMRDAEGRPTGFIAQIEDIDAQRRAEGALAEQAALIERAHDAIIGRDAEGRVTHWNRGAERLYGWSAEEMRGQPLHERLGTRLAHAPEAEAPEPERSALDYWEGTLIQRHRDGHALTVESRRVQLRAADGRPSATLEINRDLSTRREAAYLHAQFVALAGRELRAPLAMIGGALDLIASGALGPMSAEVQTVVELAQRHGTRLLRLTGNILDAESIAAGDLQFAPQTFDLAPLLERLRDEQDAAARTAGVRIELDAAAGLTVHADPERLVQVFTHLLDNAVRHAPADSAVVLRARRLPGRRAGIEVVDRGAGIDPALRARLFQRFVQAGAATGRGGAGAGLGLYIARELIERQGGTIGYDSGPDGTCLRVELPLTVAKSGAAERPRVLVVEDDALAAATFVAELSRDGYVAEVAGSVRAARDKLATGRYALVTVDMLLPDGMGEEVIRAMREDPRHVAVPVMVVSALPQNSLEAVALPVADWLPKPVRPERLQAAIAALGVHAERAQVLHVEDDPGMREYVRRLLGPRVKLFDAETLAEAEHLAATLPFDLAILDLLLPDGYGLAVAPRLHTASGAPTPVLVFSAGEPDPAQWQAIAGTLSKASATGKDLLRTVGSLLGRDRDRDGPPP